jgi:GT2 family glycosyltransferase
MTREGQLASVDLLNLENESVSSPAGENGHRVAVVVPVHNRKALTERFLKSFAEVEYENYKIVIVDDGSSDGTAEWLAKEHPEVEVLPGTGNLWWTGATNLGVQFALNKGFDYVLTINNDAVVEPNFLKSLIKSAEHFGNRAIVGCCLRQLDRPDVVWTAGGDVDWRYGRLFDLRVTEKKRAILASGARWVPADLLTGCGVLIPVECFKQIGLYNDKWYPHYHADTEFCLRAINNGFRCVVDTHSIAYYDLLHTWKPASIKEMLFSRKSPLFVKPIAAVHLQYCPFPWKLLSIIKFYLRHSRFRPFLDKLLNSPTNQDPSG